MYRPNEKAFHDATHPVGNQPGHVGKPIAKGIPQGAGADHHKAGLEEAQRKDMSLLKGLGTR